MYKFYMSNGKMYECLSNVSMCKVMEELTTHGSIAMVTKTLDKVMIFKDYIVTIEF